MSGQPKLRSFTRQELQQAMEVLRATSSGPMRACRWKGSWRWQHNNLLYQDQLEMPKAHGLLRAAAGTSWTWGTS